MAHGIYEKQFLWAHCIVIYDSPVMSKWKSFAKNFHHRINSNKRHVDSVETVLPKYKKRVHSRHVFTSMITLIVTVCSLDRYADFSSYRRPSMALFGWCLNGMWRVYECCIRYDEIGILSTCSCVICEHGEDKFCRGNWDVSKMAAIFQTIFLKCISMKENVLAFYPFLIENCF